MGVSMTEEEIAAVIHLHTFSARGRCECGEFLGSNPAYAVKHVARKIFEAMSKD